MYKLLIILFIPFILVFSQEANFAEELKAGIIYGKQHAFSISAPEGWVLDNTSGVNQGIHAVFYPVGGSWKNSITVMYANGCDIDSLVTLDSFIEGDIEKFENNNPGIIIFELDPIVIDGDKAARVIKFYGGSYEYYEAVAYIKEPKNISMLVISSRSGDEFEKSYSKFVELVKSYKYLGSQVYFNK